MKIALAYNLRTEETPEQAERYRREEVDRLVEALESLDHEVAEIEVSGRPGEIVDALIQSRCDLVFNVAEGAEQLGAGRESYCPSLFEQLNLPYTGSGPSLLQVDLDKRLTEKIMAVNGVRVPRGVVLTSEDPELPEDMPLPLFVKPNYEGTSKGIEQSSVVESHSEAQELIDKLLKEFPEGIEAEQFVEGRELTVPFLEAWPGQLLDVMEHDFSGARGEHDIYDYELKQTDEGVKMLCPAPLEADQRAEVLDQAAKVLSITGCRDLGRFDFRMDEQGRSWFLEVNPLPRLMPDGSLIIAAEEKGIDYAEILQYVIRSAARRYRIPLAPKVRAHSSRPNRKPARQHGLTIGRFPVGRHNAITDVDGVQVGHVTHVSDEAQDPEDPDKTTCVRTGVTAVVPESTDLFNNHLVAGGFVLNGIGEVSGLTQAMEWGWLETPILLTNTMSVGRIHSGIIHHLLKTHPELGRKVDVIIPLVAETDDSFLNDVRLMTNGPEDAIEAIEAAESGPVAQGSVGGGTGMISFDFAGGIGTSSRVLPHSDGGFTLGVLVQSNFGKMRNLTIDGAVVGRDLDPLYPYDIRQENRFGSVIVVVATDAPLLSAQLNRLSKRAALGLGRVGSFAASTSGEIVFAFSTGNRTSREAKESADRLNLDFVTDPQINPLYEAVIECTEEAVVNAMFCSSGQTGRAGRFAPPAPIDTIVDLLSD